MDSKVARDRRKCTANPASEVMAARIKNGKGHYGINNCQILVRGPNPEGGHTI